MESSKWRRRIFRVLTVISLLYYLAFFGLFLLFFFLLWLPDETVLSIMDDLEPAELAHRVHEMAIALIGWALILGISAQLHRPQRKVAPMVHVLVIPIVISVVELITGSLVLVDTLLLAAPILFLALVHPRSRELVRVGSLHAPMTSLATAAAIPLAFFAVSQARLQLFGAPDDPHVERGHWGFLAALAVLLVVWALIGASDRPGWRFTAWVAGGATALYAVYSLIFPHHASALSTSWAIAASVWAAVYVVAAERRARDREVTEDIEAMPAPQVTTP